MVAIRQELRSHSLIMSTALGARASARQKVPMQAKRFQCKAIGPCDWPVQGFQHLAFLRCKANNGL